MPLMFMLLMYRYSGMCVIYCAPVSKALLIRSAHVILRRTKGDTPKAAMAAVELCMESSLMFPCSQSTIMPFVIFNVKTRMTNQEYQHQDQSELQFAQYERTEVP